MNADVRGVVLDVDHRDAGLLAVAQARTAGVRARLHRGASACVRPARAGSSTQNCRAAPGRAREADLAAHQLGEPLA